MIHNFKMELYHPYFTRFSKSGSLVLILKVKPIWSQPSEFESQILECKLYYRFDFDFF